MNERYTNVQGVGRPALFLASRKILTIQLNRIYYGIDMRINA